RVDAGAHELPTAHADELRALGEPRAKAITDHLGAPLVRQLMTSGSSAAEVDAIAHAFTPAQVRGYLAEGLAPKAIGELASLDAPTRAQLLGPGNLPGASAHELSGVVGKDGLQTLAKTLDASEIVGLRAALADDALLAKLTGAGGAKLRDIVAEIGAADVKATAKALTPERFAALADAGLTGTQLKALAADFTTSQLTTLETVMSRKQLAQLYTAPGMGKPGLDVVHACALNPKIKGLNDWVTFEAGKGATANWRNALGEL